jgi:signal transduction histidine kinase
MSSRRAIELDVRKRARSRANHRIAFAGHAVVYLTTCCLLAVLFFPAAIIVALAWGIGLAAHGFFGVLAPVLRERWTEQEVARVVPAVRATERRASEDRHARNVERIAASLAHEIRNPIAAAKSLVQQIAEDPGSAETAEYARVAGAELDRVETSIAHLLRFARDEPLDVSEAAVRELVDRALHAARDHTTGVRIETDVPEDLVLDADADKVERVLVNLVTNAADAVRESASARREVRIEAGTSFDRNDVWMRVSDRGAGIDEELRERMFEPWVTTKASGNGLGMAIARKLCEAHGGRLELEKTGPNGTSMLVTLPRRPAPEIA